MENRIDAVLSPADRDAVLQALKTIRDRMPFLLDLSPEERRALPKFGDKSRAFVQQTFELANADDSFLPRSFDVDEFQRDVELFNALQPVVLAVTKLAELIDDTTMLVGSEAYAAALVAYSAAKANGKGAALDTTLDALSARFARKSKVATPKTQS